MPTFRCFTFFVILGVAIAAPRADAATRLVVNVFNATNSAPLDNAIVCVGTATNRAAMGRRTTSNGNATFETVSDGTWIVTVWRTGFAVSTNTLVVSPSTPALTTSAFRLSAGTGSNPCALPTTATPTPTVRIDGTPIYPVAPTVTTPPPAMQSYTAPGLDAVTLARQRGFLFSTIVGPCDIAKPNSTTFGNVFLIRQAASSLFGGSTTCSMNVFTGGVLATGWQFTALRWERVSGDGCSIATPPLPNQRIVVPLAVRGSNCGFVLREVTVRGPAGSRWQDAFDQ